jgi:hypothetical protein
VRRLGQEGLLELAVVLVDKLIVAVVVEQLVFEADLDVDVEPVDVLVLIVVELVELVGERRSGPGVLPAAVEEHRLHLRRRQRALRHLGQDVHPATAAR